MEEGFTLTLRNARNASLGTSVATGTIIDDDELEARVSAYAVNVVEGNTATFTVEVTGGTSTAPVKVRYAVTGTATAVATGVRSKTVSVPTIDDRVDEPLESFEVSLTGRSLPSGVLLGWASAGVMIEDDDTRGVTVSRSELRILEGLTGTYTVALTSQPTDTVTVTATVTGDDDVTVNPRSLTFPTANWSTQQTVTVKAAQDLDAIVDEATVLHTLRGGDYGTVPVGEEPVRVGTVAVTVHDDEAPAKMVILTVDPHRVSEDAGETTVTVTATLDGSRLDRTSPS